MKTNPQVSMLSVHHQVIMSHEDPIIPSNGSYIDCIRGGRAEKSRIVHKFRYAKNIDLYNQGSYHKGIDENRKGNDLITKNRISQKTIIYVSLEKRFNRFIRYV